MNSIKIIPTGGLCNRMRAMASGIHVAKELGIPAIVYWNNSKGLRADFRQLFKPINGSGINIVENSEWTYKITKRSSYLSRALFLRISNNVIFNYKFGDGNIFEHINTSSRKPTLLISCYKMCDMEPLDKLFVPIDKLADRIKKTTALYKNRTIGIHIRRTDNIASIHKSPTSMFISLMQKEIDKDKNTIFYLASDDETTKKEIKRQFSGRVITSQLKADRESLEGMEEALVELFCLSRTSKIIGS